MSRQDDIKKLITNHHRRLQKLKELQALHGQSVEPKIILEIEDIEAEIEVLQEELLELEKDLDYRLGLQLLKSNLSRINGKEDIKRDLFTLEARLLENLDTEQRFGWSATLLAERKQIVAKVAGLSDKLKLDFQLLCQGQTVEVVASESIYEISDKELSHLYQTGQELETAGYIFEAAAKYWRIWQTRPDYQDVVAKLATLEQSKTDIFVGRRGELAHLMQALERSRLGIGSVIFLSGDPGTGKTSLAQEFFKQAQARYSDIVYVVGSCSDHSGIGEPYLPFREILSVLGGEIENQLAQGHISIENARRLTPLAPLVIEIILTITPNLSNALVTTNWFNVKQSQYDVSGRKENTPRENSAFSFLPSAASEFADSIRLTLALESTLLLRTIAKNVPLILFLDDLQWSDPASIGLLHHLGTKLHNAPIMLIGAWRPSDIGSGHPLTNCISELKNRHPKNFIEINLDKSEPDFVSEFVERRYNPHQFPLEFIAQMQSSTGSNALFISELLQYLAETGRIAQNERGQWQIQGKLELQKLPTRVESVIEARITRLTDNLRKILEAASVEGEEFTAQVVANLRGMDERQLLEQLTGELERKWHLVAPSRSAVNQQQRLYMYRFKHALIRMYLYDHLSPIERELLHCDIGLFLESNYRGDVKSVSPVLADHFSRANLPEKEAQYRLMAAQAAAQIGARDTAIYHLNHLDTILKNGSVLLPNRSELTKQLYSLRGNLYALIPNKAKAESDFEQLEKLAQDDNDLCFLARALCGRGTLEFSLGKSNSALNFVSHIIKIIPEGQCLDIIADCELLAASASHYLARYKQAIQHAETAYILYTKFGDLTNALYARSRIAGGYYGQGQYKEAERIRLEILSQARQHSNLLAEYEACYNLGVVNWRRGLYLIAKDFLSNALEIARQINDELEQANSLNSLGFAETSLGRYVEAEVLLREALKIFSRLGNKKGQAWALGNLGNNFIQAGKAEEAIKLLEESKAVARKIRLRSSVAESYRRLSQAYLQLSNLTESYLYARLALKKAQKIKRQDFVGMAYHVLGQIAVIAKIKSAFYLPGINAPDTYFEESVKIAKETGSMIEQAKALRAWGEYLQQLPSVDSRDQGKELIRQAEELQQRLNVA